MDAENRCLDTSIGAAPLNSIVQIMIGENKMVELVIGAVIGAVVSLLIAEVYHKRSSKDLTQLISRLEDKNVKMGEMLDNLEEWQSQHFDDLQMIIAFKKNILGLFLHKASARSR